MQNHPEDRDMAEEPGTGYARKALQKTVVFTDSSALKIFDDVLRKTRDRNQRL